MPNTVVEAMGFGLPVITRLEGGMVDFFRNGVHGYATHSKDPRVFTDFMQTVLGDRELYRTMALNNFNFAQTHFKASQAARRLESIYAAVSNGNRRL
jgi:glycosyltransferase involved in cell wall biosynthesis